MSKRSEQQRQDMREMARMLVQIAKRIGADESLPFMDQFNAFADSAELGRLVARMPEGATADQPPISLLYDGEQKEWMVLSGDYPVGNPYWFPSPGAALENVLGEVTQTTGTATSDTLPA